MNFEKQPISWENKGTEPTEDIKQSGFTVGYKPPAAYHNYLFANHSDCIAEMQKKLGSVDDTRLNMLLSHIEYDSTTNTLTIKSDGKIKIKTTGFLDVIADEGVLAENQELHVNNVVDITFGFGNGSTTLTKNDVIDLLALKDQLAGATAIKIITDKTTAISNKGGVYYVMPSAADNMPVSTHAFFVLAFDDYDTIAGGGTSTWRFIATDLVTCKRYSGTGDDTANADAFNYKIRWTEI